MEYIKEITLDIDPGRPMTAMWVKQGDVGTRRIRVKLEQDGETYVPESGVQFLFRCQKPDGTGVILDSASPDDETGEYMVWNNGDGTLDIVVVPQITCAKGVCRCDVCLYEDEDILSTSPFIIYVAPSPGVTDIAVSSDDLRALTAALAELGEIESRVSFNVTRITLPASWTKDGGLYKQGVSVSGYTVTGATKVDLTADDTVLEAMKDDGTEALLIANNNGNLIAVAFGEAPTKALTVQACIYETNTI